MTLHTHMHTRGWVQALACGRPHLWHPKKLREVPTASNTSNTFTDRVKKYNVEQAGLRHDMLDFEVLPK